MHVTMLYLIPESIIFLTLITGELNVVVIDTLTRVNAGLLMSVDQRPDQL